VNEEQKEKHRVLYGIIMKCKLKKCFEEKCENKKWKIV
jgi:hypothetical protein